MRKYSLTLLAAAAIGLVSSAASAADLPRKAPAYAPPPPPFSWTGFYIGINGGWGGDKVRYPFDDPAVPVSGEASLTSSGALGGGQIGYNYQFATNWVAGLEADIQWSNIKSEVAATASFPGGGLSLNAGTELKWFGTVRGRLGYAWDRVLLYGTGGFAFGSDTTTLNASAGGAAIAFSHDNDKSGWTAGAGLEYAITNNLSFKTEYLYIDFGTDNVTTSVLGLPASVDEHPTVHSVRAGLNWRFGGL
jgi:outer membrane immunogenic protein